MNEGARSTVKVWDPLVRIAHWSLVVSITGAWLTRHSDSVWHEWLGYATLAIAAARIAWGSVGTPYAKFSEFVRTPAATLTYTRAVLAHRDQRYIGHNPLGAWMIVLLLLMVTLLGLTGWLSTTDAYWGIAWVADSHEALADILLALIALHIAGVILSSWRHHELLVVAMFSGRKRLVEPRNANRRKSHAANQRD